MLNRSSSSIIPWVVCGCIALFIGLHFRLYPLYHNPGSDAYEQATMMVLAKIRATVNAQVAASFPAMPPDEQQRTAQARFNEIMHNNSQKIRASFDQVGLQLLKKEGPAKRYLQESDSYYFLDLTQNVLEKGDVSAKVNGSQYFNAKMLAPLGYWEPQTWHPYIGAMVYRAARFFDPAMDLVTGLGFTPLVLFPLVLAAFFMACRALGCSWASAFTASVFFILAPIYLQRSTYGWYDNDTYSVLFPVLNLGLIFLALSAIHDLKKTILWGSLAGLSFALYARFWTGWGFSWGIALCALTLISARAFFFKEQHRRNLAVLLATIAAVTLLCLVLMIGIKQFLDLIPFAYGELKKFTMSEFKGWPDLFIVVGELHAATLSQIILLTGGPVVLLGAAAAFAAAIHKAAAGRRSPPDSLILLGLFTAVTFILGLSAERFTILLATPLALAFACGLNILWQERDTIARKINMRSNIFSRILLGILIAMTAIPVTATHRTISSLVHPIFNSAWDRALTRLREHSPAESVVDTWWSPGHFIKAVARRRVTFDGASIKGEQAYWLTKVYLSQDESAALGILRMLNTTSNAAAEFLQAHGWPLSRAVPLLTEITALPRKEAAARLDKALSPGEAAALLELTHGQPPPSYVLIYNEIVEGNVLLGYVGKWDFARIEQMNNHPEQRRSIPSKRSKHYIDFLWNLVGGQLRQSETLLPAGKDGSRVIFEQNVSVDTTDMTVTVNSPKFGKGIPASVVYFDNDQGRVIEKILPGASLGYAAVVFADKTGAPRCVLMDRMLANSLIIKMYYFEGKGLEHFKPFAQEQDLTGRTRIFVYRVQWPKNF